MAGQKSAPLLLRLAVGVEIHARVKSATKLFSRASASARDPSSGRPPAPNSFVGWLDCALPGSMPRLNQNCVNQAIVTGLALQGEVQRYSVFERKHYFYCDSPLGYQITQQSFPVVLRGVVTIGASGSSSGGGGGGGGVATGKKVRISRIQLEQDTGKSFHAPSYTLVDFNRAGSPLMEIVSEPDMSTAQEAAEYVRTIQRLLRHIGSCDGNMEDGSLRADINISVHDDRTGKRSHRVEVKNLNSLRSIERAVMYEHRRLEELVFSDAYSKQSSSFNETRTFDVKTGQTVVMREKEGQVDYRFMVEPDLPPLLISDERIELCRRRMQELPDQARERFARDFSLRPAEIEILLLNPALSSFFETVMLGVKSAPPTLVATLICNNLLGALRKQELEDDPFLYVDPEQFQQLADRLHEKQISMQRAKELITDRMVKQESIDWDKECDSSNSQGQDSTKEAYWSTCNKVLEDFPSELVKYKEGKHTLFNFFFGKAFAMLKQQPDLKPDVAQVRAVLEQVLKDRCASSANSSSTKR